MSFFVSPARTDNDKYMTQRERSVKKSLSERDLSENNENVSSHHENLCSSTAKKYDISR